MSKISRRSFLAVSAAAASGSSMLGFAKATEGIAGFDQTETDYDKKQVWKPFSDRKVRVGIVGHGVCKFGLQFGLQHHPNVELVAVSDLFPDRCADMARKAKCAKTYSSLEEMVEDDSIEAIYCATDAPAHAKHAILCMEHGKHVATRTPKSSSNAAGRTRNWFTQCSKHRVFMTISSQWKSFLRPGFLAVSSIPRGNIVILILWGHLRWALTRTGERKDVQCGIRRIQRLTMSALHINPCLTFPAKALRCLTKTSVFPTQSGTYSGRRSACSGPQKEGFRG